MTQEKKRWFFVRTAFNDTEFAVLSKVFYAYDDKYLYERSGKRTPRESSWRTWHDSEASAVGRYCVKTEASIEWHRHDIEKLQKLRNRLRARLDELVIDESAEQGAHP